METSSHGPSPIDSLKEVERVELAVEDNFVWAKTLKELVSKAHQEMKKGKPVTRLNALIQELRGVPPRATVPDVPSIIKDLEEQLRSLSAAYSGSFASSLRRAGEQHGVAVKQSADGFTVGPFSLVVDVSKELATLHYAKVPLVRNLPLDPEAIVQKVAEVASNLLNPSDVGTLVTQFEEAMRVAVARAKKPGSAARTEIRAELPAVYREMSFIRQAFSKDGSRVTSDYSLPRFVVELRTLVQSDVNTRSDRRFRLETAVLENTKDARKSVFVPNDLSVGFGEGTYYQAIVLVASA